MVAELDAVILAGGLGTRLQSVLPGQQKVVAPVAGKPFLHRILRSLAEAGCRRVILAVGYHSEQVEAAAAEFTGLDIEFSHEDTPLGTGGALRLALEKVRTQSFFAMNGDSEFTASLARLAEYHQAKAARFTLALCKVDDVSRYGAVSMGLNGAISAFHEKSGQSGPGLINAGIYVIQKEVLATIPPGIRVSLEAEILPPLCGQGLFGYEAQGHFIDIGTPGSFAEANARFRQEGNKP